MRNVITPLVMIGMLTVVILTTASHGREFQQDSTQRGLDDGSRAANTSHEGHRLIWEQNQRLCQFADKGEDGWVELDKDHKVFLQFKEMRRNVDFVELVDQKRGYLIRLYKDALFIKGGNEGFAKFEDFTLYYNGQWVK